MWREVGPSLVNGAHAVQEGKLLSWLVRFWWDFLKTSFGWGSTFGCEHVLKLQDQPVNVERFESWFNFKNLKLNEEEKRVFETEIEFKEEEPKSAKKCWRKGKEAKTERQSFLKFWNKRGGVWMKCHYSSTS